MAAPLSDQIVIPKDISDKFPEITAKIKDEISKKPEKQQYLPQALDMLNQVKVYHAEEEIINFAPLPSLINKATVLRGALKNWEPLRLLTGKHQALAKIGAEHVLLHTQVNDKIDATYISVQNFAESLKTYGGQKCIFQPNIAVGEMNPWNGEHVKIKLAANKEILALKIELQVLLDGADYEEITKFYNALGYAVYQDFGSDDIEGSGGDVYIISRNENAKLKNSSFMQSGDLRNPVTAVIPNNSENIFSNIESVNKPFMGYYFDKYSPQLNEVLEKLEIGKSPWRYKKIGEVGYLVRVENIGQIDQVVSGAFSSARLDHYDISAIEPKKGGTVLMAMNQLEIYEQFCSEFLTFLLEDVNVMAYNNGGKGLSIGASDVNSVKEAAETAYRYLHSIKKIPDKKILAKGQCFGGAPTAWLAAKHPHINLMIDQAPANFHDVATNTIKKEIKKKMNAIKDEQSISYLFLQKLYDSHAIDNVTKAILIGFDAAEDIKKNKGNNLIHINIPSAAGSGGDAVVPEKHPEMMTSSFAMKPNRIYKLSVNPGGIHVSNWFGNPDSYQAILQFLNKTELAPRFV